MDAALQRSHDASMTDTLHPTHRIRPPLKVLIAGTFDHLHAGHRSFFEQAHKLGLVTAIVARDVSVKRIKGGAAIESERTRLAKIAHSPHITRARLGHLKDFLQPILEEQPDIIALGYDQTTFPIGELKKKLSQHNLHPQIIRLKSFQPQKFKSSLLRNQSPHDGVHRTK